MKIKKTFSPKNLDEIEEHSQKNRLITKNSEVLVNLLEESGVLGKFVLELWDKERNQRIGRLEYNETEDSYLQIKSLAIENSYQGQGLSLRLYRELLNLTKEKKLIGIKSDTVVQGGALGAWKKLSNELEIDVNPEIKNEYNTFVEKFFQTQFLQHQMPFSRL